MNTLYELSSDYAELLDMATDPDTDPQAITDTLEGVALQIMSKVDDYAAVYAELDNREEAITKEIKRLTEAKKACSTAKDKMKEYAKTALTKAGAKEFTSDIHKIKLCKKGGSLPLEIDEMNVPEDYLHTEIVKTPDKEKIKKELDLGIELPFARYGERGTYAKIQ